MHHSNRWDAPRRVALAAALALVVVVTGATTPAIAAEQASSTRAATDAAPGSGDDSTGAPLPEATTQPVTETPEPTDTSAPETPAPEDAAPEDVAPEQTPSPEQTAQPLPEESDAPEDDSGLAPEDKGGDTTPDEANPGEMDESGFEAYSLEGFRPGNIMSDAVFFDKSTMTPGQIASFIDGKVTNCRSGYTCLEDYRERTNSRAGDAYCNTYRSDGIEGPAKIISKVSQACGINPQVLIVMLQKEQGLITHTWPSDWRYTIAMGQGCPDTADCDTRFYGFFNQLFGAARQMKIYGASSFFNWYEPGKTWNVQFHPNKACGSSPVYIENRATANLYYYTPYQPNPAALAAGYGAANNACATYGNRNFYNYFTDWFGSTRSGGSTTPTDPCAVPSNPPKAKKTYVVTVAVNARKAPSVDCDSGVFTLSPGTVVKGVAGVGDWLKVRTESGDRWVKRDYLRYSSSAAESACAVPGGVATAHKTYVVRKTVNARQSASVHCDRGIFSLSPGTVVKGVAGVGDWLKVRTESGDRWVKRDYLRYASASESVCAVPGGVATAHKTYVVRKTVNARQSASVHCDTGMFSLSPGTVVKGVAGVGDWLKVRTESGDRWVKRDYVRYASRAESLCTVREGVATAVKVYVTKGNTTGRTAPRSDCNPGNTTIADGTIVQALSGVDGWLKVRTESGDRWVERDRVRYANRAETSCAVPGDARTAKLAYVVRANSVEVRVAPDTGCNLITSRVAKGTVVQAISGNSNWLKVQLDGSQRWVRKADVRKATSSESTCTIPADSRPAKLTYVVDRGGATGRTGPDTRCGFGAVKVPAGTAFTAISGTDDWLKARIGTRDVWIQKSSVSKRR